MEYDIVNLIGSLGFPIAMCCALFWQSNTTARAYQEQIQKLSDVIKEHTASVNVMIDLVKEMKS